MTTTGHTDSTMDSPTPHSNGGHWLLPLQNEGAEPTAGQRLPPSTQSPTSQSPTSNPRRTTSASQASPNQQSGTPITQSPSHVYPIPSALVPPAHVQSPAPGTQPLNLPNNATTRHKRIPKVILWWWWWEIGSAFLSTGCIIAIVIILFKIADKPLQDWSLPIQPNSLIAVLTTIGKTAMMVSVVSCLSQLKFRHFASSQPLQHLQLFDDASRGPWGSLMMILSIHKRNPLAVALALITIVGLGIEPSAQQILDFRSDWTVVKNVTAELSVASHYNSSSFSEPYSGTIGM